MNAVADAPAVLGRFSPYAEYKPSGVEGLGDVPEHWEIKPLRHVCRFAYGDSLAAEDREDGKVQVLVQTA